MTKWLFRRCLLCLCASHGEILYWNKSKSCKAELQLKCNEAPAGQDTWQGRWGQQGHKGSVWAMCSSCLLVLTSDHGINAMAQQTGARGKGNKRELLIELKSSQRCCTVQHRRTSNLHLQVFQRCLSCYLYPASITEIQAWVGGFWWSFELGEREEEETNNRRVNVICIVLRDKSHFMVIFPLEKESGVHLECPGIPDCFELERTLQVTSFQPPAMAISSTQNTS